MEQRCGAGGAGRARAFGVGQAVRVGEAVCRASQPGAWRAVKQARPPKGAEHCCCSGLLFGVCELWFTVPHEGVMLLMMMSAA